MSTFCVAYILPLILLYSTCLVCTYCTHCVSPSPSVTQRRWSSLQGRPAASRHRWRLQTSYIKILDINTSSSLSLSLLLSLPINTMSDLDLTNCHQTLYVQKKKKKHIYNRSQRMSHSMQCGR